MSYDACGDGLEIVDMSGTASMRLAAVIAVIAVIAIAGSGVTAETQIHRCLLDDGTIAFQETPCPDPAPDADAAGKAGENRGAGTSTDDGDYDESAFASPFDEPAVPVTPSEATLPAPVSRDRAECEKTTRDTIDAIDLEMKQTDYSKEQGQAYLAELLALTARLRECKQL